VAFTKLGRSAHVLMHLRGLIWRNLATTVTSYEESYSS
jgi:hypothetical protein